MFPARSVWTLRASETVPTRHYFPVLWHFLHERESSFADGGAEAQGSEQGV